ncbi:MAG: sodium:proton antiporter [Roseburia sp.]|jgi:multicomponent Na+:H+ antiporter subunit F|nr:sodium:proton antiporter [Roseburia sp.]
MTNPVLLNARHVVFVAALLFLAVLLLCCFIRAVLGPKVADRIVATNMMGTIVMVMIAILAILLNEGYLVDICIIYAMISFLAVIVLTKIYVRVYQERKEKEHPALLQEQSAAKGEDVSAENRKGE